jgi:hypothetical protein
VGSVMAKVEKCARCGRRLRNDNSGWTFAVDVHRDDSAEVVEPRCPDCTTDQEAFQVEVNNSIFQSARAIDGRLLIWPTSRRPRLPLFAERN